MIEINEVLGGTRAFDSVVPHTDHLKYLLERMGLLADEEPALVVVNLFVSGEVERYEVVNETKRRRGRIICTYTISAELDSATIRLTLWSILSNAVCELDGVQAESLQKRLEPVKDRFLQNPEKRSPRWRRIVAQEVRLRSLDHM